MNYLLTFLIIFQIKIISSKKIHFCLSENKNLINTNNLSLEKSCVYTLKGGISLSKKKEKLENKIENKNCEKKDLCFSSCLNQKCFPHYLGFILIERKMLFTKKFLFIIIFYLFIFFTFISIFIFKQISKYKNYVKILENEDFENMNQSEISKKTTDIEKNQDIEKNEDIEKKENIKYFENDNLQEECEIEEIDEFYNNGDDLDKSYFGIFSSDSINKKNVDMKYSINTNLSYPL